MTKEEYLLKYRQLEERIEEIRRLQDALKQEYINSSPLSQFNIGEKVQIFIPERTVKYIGSEYTHPEQTRYAYVKGIGLDFNLNVKLKLYKAKKDGTMSKLEDSYIPHWGETVKKIEQ